MTGRCGHDMVAHHSRSVDTFPSETIGLKACPALSCSPSARKFIGQCLRYVHSRALSGYLRLGWTIADMPDSVSLRLTCSFLGCQAASTAMLASFRLRLLQERLLTTSASASTS